MIEAPTNRLAFSAASIREVGIKAGPGRDDFRVDARRLQPGLLDVGYAELTATAGHALAVARLPALHPVRPWRPFDRMLLA